MAPNQTHDSTRIAICGRALSSAPSRGACDPPRQATRDPPTPLAQPSRPCVGPRKKDTARAACTRPRPTAR